MKLTIEQARGFIKMTRQAELTQEASLDLAQKFANELGPDGPALVETLVRQVYAESESRFDAFNRKVRRTQGGDPDAQVDMAALRVSILVIAEAMADPSYVPDQEDLDALSEIAKLGTFEAD